MRWILLDSVELIEKGKMSRTTSRVPPSGPFETEILLIEMMAQTAGLLLGAETDFEHDIIFAKIENAKFLISDGKYEEVFLSESQTPGSERTVEKKIIIESSSNTSNGAGLANIGNTIVTSAENLIKNSTTNTANLIKDKTPDFLTKPMVLGISTVEGLRQNIGTATENKRAIVKKEIKALNDQKILANKKSTAEPSGSKLEKPFKSVELFALVLFSTIFNNKFIFYGILIIILFFFFRFLWHLIFKK